MGYISLVVYVVGRARGENRRGAGGRLLWLRLSGREKEGEIEEGNRLLV